MFRSELEWTREELRDTIRKHMKQKSLTQAETAQLISIERSGFTKAINGNHSFTLESLDKLTMVFELEEGAFYHLFFGECIEQRLKSVHLVFIKDKYEKFLRRCLEVGKYDIAFQLLEMLLEQDSKKLDVIYTIAESIFEQAELKYPGIPTYNESEYQQALFLYNYYVNNEADYHSEQLAICYFRIFYIMRFDVKESYEKLVMLLSVINRLPQQEKIKAYDRVMMYFYIASDWEKVLHYADILEKLAKGQNIDIYNHCLMIKSFALKETEDYQEAMRLTDLYSKYKPFQNVGYGNRMMIEITSGDLDNLLTYVSWLSQQDQRESGLSIVIRKLLDANRALLARYIFEMFAKCLAPEENILINKYRFNLFQVASQMYFELALYKEGIDQLLQAINKALALQKQQELGELLYMFETHRIHATQEQQHLYWNLLKEWKEGEFA
ncbi:MULTISPECIES: helix-turn-helix domain-containing protein [Brevibacillus]|uniref:helix-turn-helix domain-containing protein n=1 Tax=Brevibacillus TaxID=55080 RepID=UPI000B9AAD45|nr:MULTISPECIES: helix-turn-helix transcriptional regulator [Brevibacillus]MED1787364.1 helix-turn-helix transcriptional regulator [Brevibacillus laterosporus]RFB38380.1 XRE family transcriptional regulator [Brevibacillus sp. VP]